MTQHNPQFEIGDKVYMVSMLDSGILDTIVWVIDRQQDLEGWKYVVVKRDSFGNDVGQPYWRKEDQLGYA